MRRLISFMVVTLDGYHEGPNEFDWHTADWQNTTLVKDNVAEANSKLTQQPGGYLAVFGNPGSR